MNDATSPAASGPAGGHFEAQVGASYLLSMLVGAEARGLPGTIIDRVAFQRAAEGHPLDDVIVYAHDPQGNHAVLEIQVKRTVTFAPSDDVFKSVVGQIAKVAQKSDFKTLRYELGIAVARSSAKIDGPYQDVLTWAREVGDARTFMDRIDRAGSSNADMRTFVDTFRSHLKEVGASTDDDAVWQVLKRLHILTFDFAAPGSAAEELAKERSVRALEPADGGRAAEFWKVLTELAINVAKSAGDRSRDQLVTELNKIGFRLAGERRSLSARQAMSEASRHTLADIVDNIDGAGLTRHERISAVQEALGEGRYVEIRGNAGVGKSSILKHFAKQLSAETAVIALSPSRTIPKGWLSLRSVLGFDGSCHDFLLDFAASGGAILFLDGLDFFGLDERLTAADLVREAVTIPGMSVVVTTRRDFGIEEGNWLPADALDRLGRAKPVIIDELSESEINELRGIAPQLFALLSDSHPARAVAHNLFRLSRLAKRPTEAAVLRTEAEMAKDWWQSADGANDALRRDRARVLKSLAEQALGGADYLTVSGMNSAAITALVASESLRDLGDDRVMFRHDVLREWAIANLLQGDPGLVAGLPLDRPAPSDLARGFEIFARLVVESLGDVSKLRELYASVAKPGANEAWARLVLLSLVRSEIASDVLASASEFLFAEKAIRLCDLIRVVIAVESEPADRHYAAMGIDIKKIPVGVNVPVGTSWAKLIFWLLKIGTELPVPAIPDVVALYFKWAIVWAGKDPLTPSIVGWFHYWLAQIEWPAPSAEGQRRPLNGELSSSQLGSLREELRTGFLLFCNHTPQHAVAYLNALSNHHSPDRAYRALMKFRGALAQAAPEELAEITASYLMPEQQDDEEDEYVGGPFREAFGHRDLDFVPASPAQGPFYDLLLHAPNLGLALIRRVVDHGVTFKSGGKPFGNNVIKIFFPDGTERVFPWCQTYNWSRDVGSAPSVVTSGLMALEAWAHGRIEKGEPVENVVSDIIGTAPAPAAYLLVVVDILLSHWPKSAVAAVPFVACPDLLCIDRERVVSDNIKIPDIFGFGEISREPIGIISVESLKSRRSRRTSLDCLLDVFAISDLAAERAEISRLLQHTAKRLGPPKKKSTLGDASFMVLHALNRVDPNNWHERVVQTANGPEEMLEYRPPEEETDHLQPLQAEAEKRNSDTAMQASVLVALTDASRSSETFAAAAVKWAQEVPHRAVRNETDQWMREEAIVSAGLVAARDGDINFVREHRDWIREMFQRAFAKEVDSVHQSRNGLRYNPVAISFAATAYLLKKQFDLSDLRTILTVAADNAGAAQALPTVATVLAEVDERIPRALLRCGFIGCTRPWRSWGEEEAEYRAALEDRKALVKTAIEAELAWIHGEGREPDWPVFEPLYPRSRHKYSLPGHTRDREPQRNRPEQHTDHRAASLWLSKSVSTFDAQRRPWILGLATAYSNWTTVANGSELKEDDDPDHPPHEWNAAYFTLLARCLPGLTINQIDDIAIKPILSLPGEAFLDSLSTFLRATDNVYFNQTALGDTEAVHIRTSLARRLMTSRQWQWHQNDRLDSVSVHLGTAIAAVLFNDFGHFEPAKCYLLEKGIDRLGPFLPVLQELAVNGGAVFVATALLNLLEVSPRPEHLGLIRAAISTWSATHTDSRIFWVDYGIGRRVCLIIETLVRSSPTYFALGGVGRKELDAFCGKMILLGIAEAHRLEEELLKLH